MSLTEIIIERIRKHGPISFRDFMEMALYYPGLGYYSVKGDKIGKKGDYYTSSSVSSVFGEMVGRQIEEMWHICGEKKFTVVEMGAGTGLLSMDVLGYLEKDHGLYRCLDYRIIEKSPAMRDEQRKKLGEKVRWHDSIKELSGITGCIFSNELVDAFPVHLVVMEKELKEVFVDYGDGFFEVLRPASSGLREYFNELGVVLPAGYRTEINLDAVRWTQDIASALEEGFVITIDYGYPSRELYQDYRRSGTLMCYYRHTAGDDPFRHIGYQDMTSHVNFSALAHWGKKTGLEISGFTDQAHFLLGLGIEEYLERSRQSDPDNYLKTMLQVKNLFMGMGETFKVLIQVKGSMCNELSGLKFPSGWDL